MYDKIQALYIVSKIFLLFNNNVGYTFISIIFSFCILFNKIFFFSSNIFLKFSLHIQFKESKLNKQV